MSVSGTAVDDVQPGLAYLHTDHLGSIRALSDEDGAQVGTDIDYEPFGAFRSGAATLAGVTDRAFTGHRGNNLPDDDLGLIYMNARFYLPGSGRFASADTIVPDPADPQSHNRYSYSVNNPLRYTDPSGHCSGSPDGQNSYESNLCWAKVYTIDAQWNEWWDNQWSSKELLWELAGKEGFDEEYWSEQLLTYYNSDYFQNNIPSTHSAMPPLLPPIGIGGSMNADAGSFSGMLGGELIINLRSGEITLFFIAGHGPGAGVGFNGAAYVAVYDNVNENKDIAGPSTAVDGTLSLGQYGLMLGRSTHPAEIGDLRPERPNSTIVGWAPGQDASFSITETHYTPLVSFNWMSLDVNLGE